MTTVSTIAIPEILTANTYYWTPSSNASGRRKSEEKKQETVLSFFKEIGLETEISGDTIIGKNETLHVSFSYTESCKNVYKSLTVYRNGKKSNVTAIKKMLS